MAGSGKKTPQKSSKAAATRKKKVSSSKKKADPGKKKVNAGKAKKPAYAKHDPHYARESAKYKHPVPSRELISKEMEKIAKPVMLEQLAKVFKLKAEDAIEGLRRRLMAMTRDGQVMATRGQHFALVNRMQLVRGRVLGHKDGFGFLIPDEGGNDVFLSPRQMRQVFSDDVVLCRIKNIDQRGRREGSIVEVLERCTTQVVGRLSRQDKTDFVVPISKKISQDIFIPRGQSGKAKLGQFVVVSITTQPGKHHPCSGKVVEVLGDHMTVGMESELAIRAHGLPHQWSDEVLAEAKAIGRRVLQKHKVDHRDLTDCAFVTIDGADAKDFDDAVYAQRHGDGWLLRVAIADVSYYVKPDSALDKAAYERGNSVYFSSRVVPMLPESLSNGLCSLKPNVERLAMVCEMEIDCDAKLTHFTFYRAVICSHARLTYTQVNQFLVDHKQVIAKKLQPRLKALLQLYKKLHQCRIARGALDFDTTETRVLFNKKGKIDKIVPVQRLLAHRLIEECMLQANIAAAKLLLRSKKPALYRVHLGPEQERLEQLRTFLQALGLKLGGGQSPKTRHYAELIRAVQDRQDSRLIQTVLLRSLRQAIYSPVNEGHFGLAYAAYGHFTSPIRRYPDLVIHRLIAQHIADTKTSSLEVHDLQTVGAHCSMTERRADLASRDALDWLKCEYMLDKLGEQFEGIISTVTGFGFYVSLKDVYIEGLVHVSCLKNDYYAFDPVHHCLQGRQNKVQYRLGDTVSVQVARVSLDDREVDFELLSKH